MANTNNDIEINLMGFGEYEGDAEGIAFYDSESKIEIKQNNKALSVYLAEGLCVNTDYPCNPDNYTVCSSRAISYIVVHYVGATGTALQNVKYFKNNSGLKASAHYFVGHSSENAQIYQSVAPANKAWHVSSTKNCFNSNSIGVEMCCLIDSAGNYYIEDATVEMTVKLVKYLMKKYNIEIDNVLRHFDVTGKKCPLPWVNDSTLWTDFLAKLTVPETAELVNSVSSKIGLNSPTYWLNVLDGTTTVTPKYIKSVFEKICDLKGFLHSTDALLMTNITAILNLSSPDYWEEVISGDTTPPSNYMISLFTKINNSL